MSVSMIVFDQNINTMRNYATWIQIALLSILRLKMFDEDIADNFEKRFDISNYRIERPLPVGKK